MQTGFRKILMWIGAIIVIAGCSNSATEPVGSTQPSSASGGQAASSKANDGEAQTEITVLSWKFDPESDLWNNIVSAFNEKHPNIKVHAVNAPTSEIDQKITSMIAGKQPLDVLFTDSTRNLSFSSKGLLEDLGPYLEKSDIDLENDYYVKSLSDHMYQGKLHGLPILNMSYFVFYNKDLFDAAQVPYPTNDWTIEEFRETALKLTNADKNQYGYNLRPWVGTHFLAWAYAMGGEYFSEDGSEALVTSPGTVAAMQFLKDLVYTDRSAPAPTAQAASQAGGVAFESGNLAMNWSGSWDIAGTEKTPSKWAFNWGVAMPPKGESGSFPIVISNAWGIYSKSPNKDAAWKFIDWWMSDEGQMVLARNGEFPSKKNIALEHAFTHLDEETRSTVFMTVDQGVSRPTQFPAMPRSETTFGARMEEVLASKNSDVAAIMETANQELNQLIKDIAAGK
ncbi:ABC transporter substrate-binding protein [Cohnella hongkongensis]|uniref:ABC transporter substrate-binding protein n=1 Tax=Cohnella hongkongensis TaxID=178337 RepID=A0ABV9FG06_9BACL